MKRIETQSESGTAPSTGRTAAHFIAVRDSRNRRIPGIYSRNGRFYGQLWVDGAEGKKTARKYPLADADGAPVTNATAAKEAMEVLRHKRREDVLPVIGQKPSFFGYVETYFAKAETKAKKPGTLENEAQALGRWKAHLGDVRIDRITTSMIATFKDKRLNGGAKARTVNLDQIALRNVLKWAKEDGILRDLPTTKKLKQTPSPKRDLMTPAEFERILAGAKAKCVKNAEQFCDYLRFLAYSGSREVEALCIRWSDVDFKNERVTIGRDEASKNREMRDVEFNDKLGELLRGMAARRAPDCSWLFPSPQRGTRDEHSKTFRESLNLAREAAGLEWIGFHDFRHFFASFCVMAGLDFMTIAAWMGHKDGGILVGKIYGHLLQDHRQRAARKVRFELAALPDIKPRPRRKQAA